MAEDCVLLVYFFSASFSHSCSFWNAEKKVGLQVLPVFISIDPERDTVEQIREYLKGKPCPDCVLKTLNLGPFMFA